MIARLRVQRGATTEYPLAEKVRGGWQNGVTFYPDADVTKVTELTVRTAHDDQCEAEYVVGATCYTDCGCEARRSSSALEAVKADTTTEWAVDGESGHPSGPMSETGARWLSKECSYPLLSRQVTEWLPVETDGEGR